MKLHLITALSALLLCLAGPALGQIPKGYEGGRDGPVPGQDVRHELRRLLDLSINKRVVGPVIAGQPATFVLQVTNSGNVAVNGGMGIQVTDVLPNGFSLPIGGSGSGWHCSLMGFSGLRCDWLGGPIQAGAPFPPITMTAVAGAQDSYQNCARVRLTRAQDQRPANDNSCVTGRVEKPQGGRYNVGVRKSGPPSVSLGQTATFTIQVTNVGPTPVNAAAGLTVTDTVPAGFTNVAASGVGWTCIVAGAQPAQVTCTYGGPPVSANLQFPMLTITGTAAKDGPFLQCAEAIFRNQTDSNPRDNRACVEGRVTQGDKTGYDLGIRKTYKSPSQPGGPVTFSLAPFNNGPSAVSAASGVQVTDTLPPNFAPPITGVGANWSCATNSAGGGAPWTVVCDYTGPPVGVGALPVIEISAAVSKPGPFTNCAEISVRAGRDLNPRDNRACVNGEVSGPANKKPDIAITKTALEQPWSWPAGTGVYRFKITNVGDTAVPAGHVVTLTETLPAGMVLISMPGAWTCSPSVGTVGPATIVCTFLLTAALNPTAFIQFDMTVGFNGQKEPSYQNCASVGVGGRDGPWPEVNMANNRDCEPTEVGGGGGGMDIGIDKSGPTALSVGQTVTYTLSVSNASNAPLDLNTYNAPPFVTVYTPVITVTDTLPPIFNPPVSVSGGPSWNCTANGLSISCTYVGSGVIPAGGILPPITISAAVGSPGSGEQCATASIGGAWFYVDLMQGNNKDCVQVVVRSPPLPINLMADKDPIGAWPGGGGGFWFRLSATNTSTNSVPAGTVLTIIDNLPAGMRLDSQAGSFTCTPVGLIGPGPVTCALTLSAPMPPGAMEIADLQVSYVGALKPTYENCIILSASVPETTLDDNSDCASATFNPPVAPSLQIEKVVDQDCSGSAPYTGCKFMIRIFNTGGATYTGPLSFTDTVLGPSGVTLSGVSLTSPLPPGWTCSGAQPVTCTIASVTIASSSHVTIPLFMTINGAIPPVQNCAALTAPITAQSCVAMGSTHHDLALDSGFVEEFEAVNGGRFEFSVSSTPTLSNGSQLVFNGAVTTPATLSPRIVTTPLWSCSGPWSGFICTLNVTPGAYSGSVIPLGLRTYYSPNFVGQPVTFTGQIQMNGNSDPVPSNNTKTATTVLP